MLVTLGLLVVPAVGATAAAKAAASLSLTASTATIAPNGTTTIKVKLRARSAPVKKAKVTVQQRRQGTATWKTLKKVVTSSSGVATVKTSAQTKNFQYRAVFAGTSTVAKKTSSTVNVKVKQSVTVTKTSAATITAGDTVTLTGTTSPALAKGTVALQILDGKTWSTIARSTVSASRTFTVSAKATKGGTVSYRAYVAGTKSTSSAVSATKKFNVYSWYYLSDLSSVARSKNYTTMDDVTINAKIYKKSVGPLVDWGGWGGLTSGTVEYNLSYRCTRFQATAGIPDSSGSKTTWSFRAAVDDLDVVDTSASLAKPQPVDVNVSGGFRLYLSNTRVDGDPWQDYSGDAAWGNARLLCLGTP